MMQSFPNSTVDENYADWTETASLPCGPTCSSTEAQSDISSILNGKYLQVSRQNTTAFDKPISTSSSLTGIATAVVKAIWLSSILCIHAFPVLSLLSFFPAVFASGSSDGTCNPTVPSAHRILLLPKFCCRHKPLSHHPKTRSFPCTATQKSHLSPL